VIAPVVRIFPNGEHAAQVDGATDGTECFGKQMERMDIGMQGCAKVCQLLRGQAWVFTTSRFIPGTFADWADKEEMPVSFSCRHGILS